jgi:hypothetical protein
MYMYLTVHKLVGTPNLHAKGRDCSPGLPVDIAGFKGSCISYDPHPAVQGLHHETPTVFQATNLLSEERGVTSPFISTGHHSHPLPIIFFSIGIVFHFTLSVYTPIFYQPHGGQCLLTWRRVVRAPWSQA